MTQTLLLGIHRKKTVIQKDLSTPVFTAALFTITRTWEQPKCPSTEELIKEMFYIYIMEYFELWCWRRLLRVPWT